MDPAFRIIIVAFQKRHLTSAAGQNNRRMVISEPYVIADRDVFHIIPSFQGISPDTEHFIKNPVREAPAGNPVIKSIAAILADPVKRMIARVLCNAFALCFIPGSVHCFADILPGDLMIPEAIVRIFSPKQFQSC